MCLKLNTLRDQERCSIHCSLSLCTVMCGENALQYNITFHTATEATEAEYNWYNWEFELGLSVYCEDLGENVPQYIIAAHCIGYSIQ